MKAILMLLISMSIFVQAEFKRDSNGVVTDTKSALFWQDNQADNDENNANEKLIWKDALVYCESLTLGEYNDWRVPNINELLTLLDRTKSPPRSEVFIYILTGGWAWSSTTKPSNPDNAMSVYFGAGGQYFSFGKLDKLSVRCVRGGL